MMFITESGAGQTLVDGFVNPDSAWVYQNIFRSHLKKEFWPNLCVGASFQLLGILTYARGLNFEPALTLNQNSIFEMASNNVKCIW